MKPYKISFFQTIEIEATSQQNAADLAQKTIEDGDAFDAGRETKFTVEQIEVSGGIEETKAA